MRQDDKAKKRQGESDMKSYPAIGIRPIVDSRRMGIRDALEGKVREMAEAAKS